MIKELTPPFGLKWLLTDSEKDATNGKSSLDLAKASNV